MSIKVAGPDPQVGEKRVWSDPERPARLRRFEVRAVDQGWCWLYYPEMPMRMRRASMSLGIVKRDSFRE